jgi:signal transduction histidine kinase/ActR/RegA family two-component response regulator
VRLTQKLLLSFVPILIVTISSLGFLSYYLAKQHTQERELYFLEILTRQVTQSIVENRVELLIQSGLAEIESFKTAYQSEVFAEFTKLQQETGKSFHIVHQPSGTLVYTSTPSIIASSLVNITWPKDRIFLSGTYTENDQQRLFSGFYFAYWEWEVFVSESVDIIAQPINQLRSITIFATIFASTFGSLLFWWISNRVIIGPVKQLKKATQVISKTKKHIPIKFSSQDELSDLANELTSMSIEIEDSIEKIETANRAKNDFLATISHEIRTPLNGLIGSAQLLNNTTLTPAQNEYVDALLKSSQTLSSVINDVLDLSKIESGKLAIDNTPVYPIELMQTVEVIFVKLAQENGTRLTCHCSIDEQTYIYSDPVRLRQILLNLVSNAVKFTVHGSIQISMKLVPPALQNNADINEPHLFYIIVTDTGIGIEESRLDAVFESFTQSDSSTTRNYGGTGLGLTIVKKILALLNGTISVSSKINEGSTFTVAVPVNIGISEHSITTQTLPQSLEKEPVKLLTILLVEDNEINTMVAQHMLEQIGYRVISVTNGQYAVAAVQAHQFDLVLMDIHMPIMDGEEATKQIRALPDKRLATIPIIGLIAEAFADRHKEFIAIGMNDVITKPINQISMITTIQKVMFASTE